ncbi:hypothetical protein V8E51_002930 [Hyaloscypha variabilis]
MIPGSERSHVARGEKRRENRELPTEGEQPPTSTPSSRTESDSESVEDSSTVTVPGRLRKTRTNAKGTISPRRTTISLPYEIGDDILQHLPPHDPSAVATGVPLESRPSTFKFFGEAFVKQFLMTDHEDYSIMLSGCMLVSYANTMALSGSGTKAALLGLKGQVINRINAKIESSGGLLSPQCLVAILALGAPIVCLVSQDLPHSLSIWDYINITQHAEYLCCTSFAEIAQNAHDERKVHSQAMYNLFSKISGRFRDQDSFSLLLYLSNYMDLTMALQAANHLNTPVIEVASLFPTTFPCMGCSIPAEWTSPLTCQWLTEESSAGFEGKMLNLVGLAHKWLATFLDGDGRMPVPTEDILEQRSRLRAVLETFEPVTKAWCCEAEAMYSCCLWATLVLLKVERLSVPIYVAAKYTRSQPKLTRRMRTTDLSNLWGNRRGLLFYVAAVCDFSTAGQCYPLLCTTLFARMAQEISMLDCSAEVGIKALRRLKFFESMCCDPVAPQESTNLDFRSYLSAYSERNDTRANST